MKKILLSTILVLALAATGYALPVKTAEYGVTPRDFSPAQDQCALIYYNFCSFWVYYWTFGPPGAVVGTCYDLNDCCENGCEVCRFISHGYWGTKRFSPYGYGDFALWCVDDHCCPTTLMAQAIGVPLNTLWTGIGWGVAIDDYCPGDCEFLGTFTITFPNDNCPYSDGDNLNADDGCGTTWTCVPHSYVYVAFDTLGNEIDYCALTGYPAFMFYADTRSYCETQFGIGFYHNWLADMYIDCVSISATESNTWGEIKALYK